MKAKKTNCGPIYGDGPVRSLSQIIKNFEKQDAKNKKHGPTKAEIEEFVKKIAHGVECVAGYQLIGNKFEELVAQEKTKKVVSDFIKNHAKEEI